MKKILLIVFFTVALSQQSCVPPNPFCVAGPFQPGMFVVTSLAFNMLYPYAYTYNNQYYCGYDQGVRFWYDQTRPNYWIIRNLIQTQGRVLVRLSYDWLGRPVLSY
jgi:hypothetical protein